MSETRPGPAEPGPESAARMDAERAVRDAERRRRRARVFGDVLPDGTGDERAEGWGDADRDEGHRSEEWLRRQVPPHHG